MGEQSFFQDALTDFTSEIAYGDAVKRLVDEGFSLQQIMEKIDYPAPVKKVQKIIYNRLCETNVILEKVPEHSGFTEHTYSDRKKFWSELLKKCSKNSEKHSYVYFEIADYLLENLERRKAEYLSGINFENSKICHLIDFRMREILYELYEKEGFYAECYFLKSKEIIYIGLSDKT